MAVCDCKGKRCVCEFAGGGGIAAEGNGNARNPYLFTHGGIVLQGSVNDSAEVTVDYSPAPATPADIPSGTQTVSVDILGSSVAQTVFEPGSSTFVKPDSGTVARVIVIGGGGGGGGVGALTDQKGGGGGGGGAMSVGWFPLALLPDEVEVQVGAGGAGAGGGNPNDTVGETGGASWFGPYLRADGGQGGRRGGQGTPGPTRGGTPPEGGPGGQGGYSQVNPVSAEEHYSLLSPTGGAVGYTPVYPYDANENEPGEIHPSKFGPGGRGGRSLTTAPDTVSTYYGGGGAGQSRTASAILTTAGHDGGDGVVIVQVW